LGVNLTVLLAEDNPVNQQLTRTWLEQFGHRVLTADDGQQALETLKHQQVDLLMLDVMMPGVDGLSVLKALRLTEEQNGTHLPVVMLTGQALDGDQQRFIALGADAYVSKPVNRDKLEQAIKQLRFTAP
jgi:hypothetical protein